MLRRGREFTQREIALRLGLSHEASYHKYESGKVIPPADKLAKLAELYGVSVDYLLGREAAPHGLMAEGLAGQVEASLRAILARAGPRELGELAGLLEEFRRRL